MNTCANASRPCRSIFHAISESNDNDTITVAGGDNTKDKINSNWSDVMLGNSFPLVITKSLHFLCLTITCKLILPTNSFAFVAGHTSSQINVSFIGFEISEEKHKEGAPSRYCKPSSHGFIIVRGCSLRLSRCTLKRLCTAVYIFGQGNDISEVYMSNSSAANVHYTIYSKNVSLIKLEMRNTSITGENDSPVPYYAVSLIIRDVAFIHIANCTFYLVNEAIAVSMHQQKLFLKVEQCQFTDNTGQSILLNFHSLLRPKESKIHLHRLIFMNNDAGFASSLHLIRTIKRTGNDKEPAPTIRLTESIFENNYAQAFFGAIYADGVDLDISHTVFNNNSAGNEDSSIQAFGGAIFVESRTNVKTTNCTFTGNTCSGFGGAVFSRGNFQAVNCLFKGSFEGSRSPLLGDILYVTAGLFLENTTWYPGRSYRSNSAIWHPGSPTLERWSIEITGYFSVHCPVGHNITGHGVIRKPGMLTDRISMGCRSCPRNHYSLQSGYLKVISQGNKITSIKENRVCCHLCRYGGVCEEGKITAKSNYYGHLMKDSKEVKFISCPFGYCCEGANCRSYNSCNPLRIGTLCGSCIAGTTENLLNAKCVKKSECSDKWFWSVYFPVGIIYIVFFMYIDKINKFIKGQFVWWENTLSNERDNSVESTSEETVISKLDTKPSKGTEQENYEAAIEMDLSNEGKECGQTDNIGSDGKRESPVRDSESTENSCDDGSEQNTEHLGQFNGLKQKTSLQQSKQSSDVFSDVINIVFYFYQIIFIIREHDNTLLTKTLAFIKEVSNSIFTFSIGSKSALSLCPIEGLTPITKSILVRSIAIYVITMLFVMNIANATFIIICKKLSRQNDIGVRGLSFSIRLRVTTIQIMLLAYSTVANMIINFVNCVPVNGHYVLYMDGTIRCFNWLQVLALLFIAVWIIPFPLALVLGIYRMHYGATSYNRFILGLICPFCLIICGALRTIRQSTLCVARGSETDDEIERQSTVEILRRFEAPFKGREEPFSLLTQPGMWQGVMIMRRLIIILLFTFVNSPVTRLYCIFIACLLFLMHHLITLPYKNNFVNIVETCSSATLVILCSVNLFFAYSYVSNVPPEHADDRISAIFDWLEVIIIVFFPVLFVLILVTFALINIFRAIYRGLTNLNKS